MTEKKITIKSFLHKSRTKAANAAKGFIAGYREFLVEQRIVGLPEILAKLDNDEIMPTPALNEIKDVAFAHMLALDCAKAEAQLERAQNSEPAKNKAQYAVIYNAAGEVQTYVDENGEEKELMAGFELHQEAMGWSDRKLVECSSDCYSVIESMRLIGKDGNTLKTIVLRDDAMSRIFRAKKMALHKVKPQTTSRLGFGVKAKGDHSRFSRG